MKFEQTKHTTKKNKTITLRMIEVTEAEKLLQAMVEIAATSPYILRTAEDFSKMSIEDEVKWIESSNNNERGFLIGAIHEDKIIGLMNFGAYKNEKMKHRGLLGISIHHEFRGEGIGEIFFNRMLDLAKRIEGLTQAELSVMEKNERAKFLYKKMGFIEVGRMPNAFLLEDGSLSDDITMVRVL